MTQRLVSYFGSPELRQLSAKAGRLRALQQLYEQIVPASLRHSSHVQQLEQHTLVLAADNGAVAAKLRQLAPELARQFHLKLPEVTGIQVRVQVAIPAAKPSRPHATLSSEGRQRLSELSDSLPDSPLKSALRHLLRKSAAPTRT